MDINNIVDGHAERFDPAMAGFNIVYEHLHRYAYAAQFVKGKRVLDLACGEGYGSSILSEDAAEVVGIDKDDQVIQHAATKYQSQNLSFKTGNIEDIPFDSDEFDVVVCFEAIEHIQGQERCVAEARRVLKPDGMLLISTPVKSIPEMDSQNPFHLKELTLEEFKDLITTHFKQVRLAGQRVSLVSDIWDTSGTGKELDRLQLYYEKNDDAIAILKEPTNKNSDYLIAVAYDRDIAVPARSLLMNAMGDEVDRLLTEKDMALTENDIAMDCATTIFKKKHDAATQQMRQLLAAESMIMDLKGKLIKKDAVLQKLTSLAYRITPVKIKTRPPLISDKVSIIIPVRNGGDQLKALLTSIASQRRVENIEIVVIDSGSTDGSVQTAEEHGAKVVTIPQKEFNHGSTRNLAATEASGDYLVFTVQDAVPLNNYWLYNMLCPFIEYPELDALSVKQFVKPEAALFNLWKHQAMNEMLSNEDVMCSLSDAVEKDEWKSFDSSTKRLLAFFDNVSSCIRRSVFEEIQFTPIINAEDIDYGVKLLESKKVIGHLVSTGVYHWHEKGAVDVLKRHYVGTKAQVYVLRNELPNFFDVNNYDWKSVMGNITGFYDLIKLSLTESRNALSSPQMAVKELLHRIQKNIDTTPVKLAEIVKASGLSGDSELDNLLKGLVRDTAFTPEQLYNFKRNCLVPNFMAILSEFSRYLLTHHNNLEGREEDFIACIYQIFAMSAGDALGAYYLEAETTDRLTAGLEGLDNLLAEGICFFRE